MDVIEATNAELAQNPNNLGALLRQGIVYFELEEYESAKGSFERGLRLDPLNADFKKWLRKVDAELELDSSATTTTPTPDTKSAPATTTATTAVPDAPATVAPPSQPPRPQRFRHEWYQSVTHVMVELFVKGIKKDQVEIEIDNRALSICIKLDSSTDFNLHFSLFDEIVPELSKVEFLSTKIEIKLKKRNANRNWDALEMTPEQEALSMAKVITPEPTATTTTATAPRSYPSSSKKRGNWDEIEREISIEDQNEKPEGDAALSKLFQQIFLQGSDETRRAMMKSFTESGGTVLSTNWEEVGKKKVEMTPPSNMEFRKWDE